MLSQFKRALILAPHTDDGELGVGGTICRLIESGVQVYYVAFSTAEESVPEGFPKDILKTEVLHATKVLGIPSQNVFLYNYKVRNLNFHRQDILQHMIELRASLDPDLIFMPSLQDIHQDHLTIAQEGLRAYKTRTLLGYELIWNNLTFGTDLFISLKEKHLDQKVNALHCYESQRHRNYTHKDFIFSLARSRGVQIGTKYAESFEVVRWVI